MSTGKLPPYNQVEWNASAIADGAFGGYRVYVRPAILPAPPFLRIGDLPAGSNAAAVKANHLKFRDYSSGWGGDDSPWSVGHDYLVTAWNWQTTLESKIYGSPVVRKVLNPDTRHWIVVPEAPYLNAALNVRNIDQDWVEEAVTENPGFAGRPYAFTRTRLEREGRKWSLDWYYHSLGGLPEERVRWPYAIAASGRTGTLLVPDGDRYVGTLRGVKASRSGDKGTTIDAEGEFLETADFAPAGYNLPSGVKLNGTSQYLRCSSTANLNPGTSAFSVVLCGAFVGTNAKIHLSKRAAGDGYEFLNTATNQFAARFDGASATVTLTFDSSTSPGGLFDGGEHVVVMTTEAGTGSKRLYVDGVLKAASNTAHGSVTNSDPLDIGTDGGAIFTADTIHAAAFYLRALTPAEVDQTGYLLTWSGRRMPGGPETFLDLRDQRCWKGVANQYEDLSGNRRGWTSSGSPTTIGDRWRLQDLDVLAQVV